MPFWKSLTLKEDRVWLTKPCMVPFLLYMYRYTRRGMKSDVKEITNAWAGNRAVSAGPRWAGEGAPCPRLGNVTKVSSEHRKGWGHSWQPLGDRRLLSGKAWG